MQWSKSVGIRTAGLAIDKTCILIITYSSSSRNPALTLSSSTREGIYHSSRGSAAFPEFGARRNP
jgi:hypothetical protein